MPLTQHHEGCKPGGGCWCRCPRCFLLALLVYSLMHRRARQALPRESERGPGEDPHADRRRMLQLFEVMLVIRYENVRWT